MGNYAVSENVIPEPHEFSAILKLGSDNHIREFRTHFHEHHHHETDGFEKGTKEYQDAHELAHANDIKRRFDGKEVTNWQILLFGLQAGLFPCPAAITVLLICIQQGIDPWCYSGCVFQYWSGLDASDCRCVVQPSVYARLQNAE
jgi:nickel/cobalt exporter